LVRVAGFFAFGVELVFEPVRLAVKARVPCLREPVLDLVLLVLDFEEDIMIGIVVIGRNEHEKKRGERVGVGGSPLNTFNLPCVITAD